MIIVQIQPKMIRPVSGQERSLIFYQIKIKGTDKIGSETAVRSRGVVVERICGPVLRGQRGVHFEV